MKAFARIDGALLGLIWVISFACFIGNFHNPMWGLAWFGLIFITPFFVGFRIDKFRRNVLDGAISFRRALGYSMFTFIYSSLILAIAQYIYFQFMDNGFVSGQYISLFSNPQYKALFKASGITGKEMSAALDMLTNFRPIDFAVQGLFSNIAVGFLLSLPIALVMNYRKTRTTIINK